MYSLPNWDPLGAASIKNPWSTSAPPKEGQVADGNYRYLGAAGLTTPNSGTVYKNGQWVTQGEIAAGNTLAAQQAAQTAASGVSVTAANKLSTLLTNPASVVDTPGYQFSFNQGLEGVNRTAAAKGMLGSGNRLYDLTKFGQGLASTTYGNTVNQLGNFLNKNQMSSQPYQNAGGGAFSKVSGSGSSSPSYLDLGGVY